MEISLCVICGNEAHHILAMLESFDSVFDELCLVRAVGAKQPDDTVKIASDWCLAYNKRFVTADHKNQFGCEKWEHVDSFSAARNEAFALGTGDWLIWADCDDILLHKDSLRSRLEKVPEDVLMVRCPYDVRGSGKKLFRERAIRRSAFASGRKWHHDVHENLLLIPNDRHEDWQTPIWLHAPVEVKRENRRRNLKILANSVREVPTQYFYIHQEHFCSGNRDAALEFGKIALNFPNLMPAFRYEALINMAKLCGSRREAMAYLMSAHGVFPWCREAIANIILLAFEKDDFHHAMYWADKMLLLREPLDADRPWTHEPKFYGWAGYDIGARAFRGGGNVARADVCQWQFHEGATPKISLVHATRGRSSKAVACREMWLSMAQNPAQVEHIFAVDADDETSMKMSKQFVSVVSEKQSCVAGWNMAARKARGDLIVQLSDDWVPCDKWDTALLSQVAHLDLQKDEAVIAVNDGHRKDQLLCMAIMSRARLEKQGEMFFHGYESVYSDNEFSMRAWADKVVIDARDRIKFEHKHPSFGTNQMDATYQHNNNEERYKAGLALFKSRNPSA